MYTLSGCSRLISCHCAERLRDDAISPFCHCEPRCARRSNLLSPPVIARSAERDEAIFFGNGMYPPSGFLSLSREIASGACRPLAMTGGHGMYTLSGCSRLISCHCAERTARRSNLLQARTVPPQRVPPAPAGDCCGGVPPPRNDKGASVIARSACATKQSPSSTDCTPSAGSSRSRGRLLRGRAAPAQ